MAPGIQAVRCLCEAGLQSRRKIAVHRFSAVFYRIQLFILSRITIGKLSRQRVEVLSVYRCEHTRLQIVEREELSVLEGVPAAGGIIGSQFLVDLEVVVILQTGEVLRTVKLKIAAGIVNTVNKDMVDLAGTAVEL